MSEASLKIEKDTVVELMFELCEADGTVLEKSEDPIEYLHGGYSGMFDAVEEKLDGLEAGAAVAVRLEPEDGFGVYDAELKRSEPRTAFPKEVEVGQRFEGRGAESGHTHVFTITAIDDENVEVDGNHPYAGKILDFNCTVMSVRRATREEIQHGHVHGPGGHHH
jgi:FKBP-type peptidyl-prolyl cis-trans isomerase SlyD